MKGYKLADIWNSKGLYLSLSALIVVFTFPVIGHHFIRGMDGGYQWAFNHLFDTRNDVLKEVINPFGPFGFLRAPLALGDNLLISILFQSLIKLSFLWSIFTLNYNGKKDFPWRGLVLSLVSALILDVEFLYVGLVFILLLLSRKKKASVYFWIAALLSIFSVLIHVGIAAKSGVVLLSYLVLLLTDKAGSIIVAWHALSMVGISIILGLLFLNLDHILPYYIQSVRFVVGYGDAMSLHPDSHYYYVFVAYLALIIPMFALKNQQFGVVVLLGLILSFAVWKQAISREELFHARILFRFFVLMWILLLSNLPQLKYPYFIFCLISIGFSYMHLTQYYGHKVYNFNVRGIQNFKGQVLDYNEYCATLQAKGQVELSSAILGDSLRQLIGNDPIDIFPNDLTIVPANDLNWKPRKTIQSGTFTKWLDQEEATIFRANSNKVLIHHKKHYPNQFLSDLDHRYLINNTPLTIDEILSSYRMIYQDSLYSVFEKSAVKERRIKAIDTIQAKMNDWINIPAHLSLLKASVSVSETIGESLINFMHKAPAQYVSYRLSSGEIFMYSINPKAANYGLWVDPFLPSFDIAQGKKVEAIRFSNSRNRTNQLSIILFEMQREIPVKIKSSTYIDSLHSPHVIQKVESESFSHSFIFSMDSLAKDSVQSIRVQFENNMPRNQYAFMVFQFEGHDQEIVSRTFNLNEQKMVDNMWTPIHGEISLSKADYAKFQKLKVFVWNPGPVPINVQGLKLWLYSL